MGKITDIELFLRVRRRYNELKAWKSALNNIFRSDWKTAAPILNYSHSLLIRNISLPPPHHLGKKIDPVIGLAGKAGYMALAMENRPLADEFFSIIHLRKEFLLEKLISFRPKSENQILYAYLYALLLSRIDGYLPLFSQKPIESKLIAKIKIFLSLLNRDLLINVSNREMRNVLDKRITLFCGKSFSLSDYIELTSFNPRMYRILNMAFKSAQKKSKTVIYGETGTGKEALAKLMHNRGEKKDKPFIILKCDSISENEIAKKRINCRGGTIFSDNIEMLNQQSQLALLNFIKEEEKKRGLHAHLIFGSEKDLWHQVEKDEFNRELYFKIHTLTLHLPSLEERNGDIPFLSKCLIAKYSEEKEEIRMSEKALYRLSEHRWKWNLIELENVIQRALIIRSDKNLIRAQDIQFLEGPSQSPSHIFAEKEAVQKTGIKGKHIPSAKIPRIRQKVVH